MTGLKPTGAMTPIQIRDSRLAQILESGTCIHISSTSYSLANTRAIGFVHLHYYIGSFTTLLIHRQFLCVLSFQMLIVPSHTFISESVVPLLSAEAE